MRYTIMIILQASLEEQYFYFIPRDMELNDLTFEVVDDITKNLVGFEDDWSFDLVGDKIKGSVRFTDLKEDRFYTLYIKKSGEGVIYKDKIFVTNQSINQIINKKYSINKNEYIEQETSNNDYIVI